MEQPGSIEFPAQELQRISAISEEWVERHEVETGYDLRWVHDDLQAELDRQLEGSFLDGQVVRLYFADTGTESDEMLTLRDASGTAEWYPAGYSLVGTLSGLYIDPVFEHDNDPVTTTFRSWQDAISHVTDGLRLQRDLREESLAVPLHTDGIAVTPRLGLLVRPFSLPLGSELDPETTVVEIPQDVIVAIDFPERESPFAADQNALLQQYYNLLSRADALPEEAQFIFATMDRVLDSFLSVLADKNPANIRKLQFAVADRSEPSYLLYDKARDEALEVSRVRRFGAYFLGYEIALPEAIDLNADEVDVPELFVMVQEFDDDDETGGTYKGLPFSDIIEAQCEDTRLEEVDQGLFNGVRDGLYEQLQEMIDRDPQDHQAVLEYAVGLVRRLNNGAVADIDYEEHRALVVQIDRDSGGYELGVMQPGGVIGSGNEELEYLGAMDGGAQIAESYSFDCNLVGYYLVTQGIEEGDTDIAVDIEDFNLMLVLAPAPDSVFRFFEGNVVITSINAITNARYKISPHALN